MQLNCGVELLPSICLIFFEESLTAQYSAAGIFKNKCKIEYAWKKNIFDNSFILKAFLQTNKKALNGKTK